MRRYNLLSEYPVSKSIRYVGSNLRTIKHRIIASERDREFYDGDRNNGYGGFKYDGRWKKIARKICEEYKLDNKSSFLQLGCENGFLLHDLKNIFTDIDIFGLETSDYAIENSMEDINKFIKKTSNYLKLDFTDNKFDFILALGVVYTHNISNAIQCLKEIQRVGKGRSFINLASYETKEDYWMFKQWSLLGTTILQEDEWIEILKYCNYTGDYSFTSAHTLKLKSK